MFLPKLSQLLVTLPVLAMPLTAIAVKPVMAAGAAEEAVRILARARTVNEKCGYLSSSERNELSRYEARAEIAAANQSSAKRATSAASAGAAEGRKAGCSSEAEVDVRETLLAAREAVREADRRVAKPAYQQEPKPQPAKAARTAEREEAVKPVSRGLGFYARVVGAYYLERECKSLPGRDAERFWKGIAKVHKETLAQNGKAAVARVMKQAERNARGSSCGSSVQARIERGYQDVTSR
jgi:hypothetical protein